MSSDGYAAIDTANWIPGTRYFTQITEEDHSAWLYIITLLSFVYVIIAFIIRFIVKYGMYGHDDWALLASTVLAIGQYISVLVAVAKGLGKASGLLEYAVVQEIQRYAAAHAYFFVLAHCCSKVSTAILTQRLFENGRRRNAQVCWALVIVAASFGVISVLALGIDCVDAGYVSIPDHCPHRFTRWQILMAVDIITEALLVIVPIVLLLDILIKPSAKLTVTMVFGVRLFNVLFAAMNLAHIANMHDSKDVALDVIHSLMWTQTELLWSILAASLPCLKTFMRPFHKIDDDTWRTQNQHCPSARSARSGRSWRDTINRAGLVALGDLKINKEETGLSAPGSDSMDLRPDVAGNNVEITGPDANSEEIRRSWGSQERIIIKKQEEFEVTMGSADRMSYQIR
ncbi:hypothetical protein CLAFUW4_05711 [Fulvia fulva]|nr:hypothetical protein CLAFUR4_05705 [Fulvia fulva]WPV15021.1 hypothetical protein CLAFUW4_05711 [Fulvia fulva]WPV29823.1 hypothetical protein CLAFUW7_05709 [Fulvia fulva]